MSGAETRCAVLQLACDKPDDPFTPIRDTLTKGPLWMALTLRA